MNTIILAKAEANLTKREYEKYTFGSLIMEGDWFQEIAHWKVADEKKGYRSLKTDTVYNLETY